MTLSLFLCSSLWNMEHRGHQSGAGPREAQRPTSFPVGTRALAGGSQGGLFPGVGGVRAPGGGQNPAGRWGARRPGSRQAGGGAASGGLWSPVP